MTRELKLFTFAPTSGVEFSIRTVWVDGFPWFIAADVCRALGMDMAHGTYQWLQGLAGDERRILKRWDLPEIFSGTSVPNATIISESGLYRLVMRSDQETARTFQDWVTREVLVSIRATGGFGLAAPSPAPLQLPAQFPTQTFLGREGGLEGFEGRVAASHHSPDVSIRLTLARRETPGLTLPAIPGRQPRAPLPLLHQR